MLILILVTSLVGKSWVRSRGRSRRRPEQRAGPWWPWPRLANHQVGQRPPQATQPQPQPSEAVLHGMAGGSRGQAAGEALPTCPAGTAPLQRVGCPARRAFLLQPATCPDPAVGASPRFLFGGGQRPRAWLGCHAHMCVRLCVQA